MKGMVSLLAIMGFVGFAYACPDDKAEHTHASHEEHTIEPYKSTFVEGADLSAYTPLEFKVKGVMCENCLLKIEAQLKKIKEVVGIEYKWESKTLRVYGKDLNADKILSAIKKAGYKAEAKKA